jgi:hypothetical protein
MGFLSRLRPRHEKPQSDTDEVRDLGPDDEARLKEIAKGSGSIAARRAAVRKLTNPDSLKELVEDPHEGVREDAARALLDLALGEGPGAPVAAEALKDTRHLITLTRSAALPGVRNAALDRLESPHALATVSKTASDPAIRMRALVAIKDPELILAVALKSEHKDTAVKAMESLQDLETVRIVAESETSKAGRRARARLQPSVDAQETTPSVLGPEADAREESVEASPPVAPSVPEAPEATPPPEAAAPPEAAPHEEPPTETIVPTQVVVVESAGKDGERNARIARVDALCGRAEAEARSPAAALRKVEAILRDVKTEAAHADLPPRLVRRLKTVRTALFARAQELREAEDWGRWATGALQEELCRRAEALLPREDYPKVAEELRQLDAAWQQTQQAPPGQADVLRKRYQEVRGGIKARLEADLASRRNEEAANRAAKETLCSEAEALSDSTEWLQAGEGLKVLQQRWKAVGPTSRRDSLRLWTRFRAACDKFFKRRHEDRARRKEEWGRNLAQKEALCAQAEALQGSTDWERASGEIRKLQAAWKDVGAVRHNRSDQVWQRFRTACDAFFERYKHRDELALKELVEQREAAIAALEAFLPEGTTPPEDLARTVQALQAQAQKSPLPSRSEEQKLYARLIAARDRLAETYPESFRGTELDPEANRVKREKLCQRVEGLAGEAESLGRDTRPSSAQELALRLKEALAARTIGGADEAASRRRALQEEAALARSNWNRIGPVPGEAGRALDKRFEEALARLPRTDARKGG